MRCDWESLIGILPFWLRDIVNQKGKERLQELWLRVGSPPRLYLGDEVISCTRKVVKDDLLFCINTASRYSPWSAATARHCYITASGGHRIGICGQAIVDDGSMTGIRDATSICIRVARDIEGVAESAGGVNDSILIIGKPGSGKTTFLRDLIRCRSRRAKICVIDERNELFPLNDSEFFFEPGLQTNVLSGASKPHGINAALRTMGPECIATDEITEVDDCNAMIQAAWCGVTIIATAHAADRSDLMCRSVYKPLVSTGIFDTLISINPDKSWRMEDF